MKPEPPEPAPDFVVARQRRPFDTVRENLEAIAVAIVLALIIRHFSVEAFEIPTGSMAPNLYGIHSWITCPNCDTNFNFGLQSDSASGEVIVHYEERLYYHGSCPKCQLPRHESRHGPGEPREGEPVQWNDTFVCPHDGQSWIGARGEFDRDWIIPDEKLLLTCPNCWYQFREVVSRSNRSGGHKILVDKFAYRIGSPRRWDVIVFQFDRETNYIKRLIGLPGERVLLRGGDVYINGKIERKHTVPGVQEALWTKVHDLTLREKGYQKLAAWKEVHPRGAGNPVDSWQWKESTLQWSANTRPGKTAVLRYQRPLINYYHYNLQSNGQNNPNGPWQRELPRAERTEVGDKKVSFVARPARGARGWVGAEIRDGDFIFQARIPIGDPSPSNPAALRILPPPAPGEAPGIPDPDRQARDLSITAPVSIRPDSTARVEFENLDDRVALRIDEREVFYYEYDSRGAIPRGAEENTLLLLAGDGAACDLEAIRVYRDIFYTEPDPRDPLFAVRERELTLAGDGPERQYFPCGDNSPSSYDGRYWHSVPESSMMGRALLVFWPMWPSRPQFKFIK